MAYAQSPQRTLSSNRQPVGAATTRSGITAFHHHVVHPFVFVDPGVGVVPSAAAHWQVGSLVVIVIVLIEVVVVHVGGGLVCQNPCAVGTSLMLLHRTGTGQGHQVVVELAKQVLLAPQKQLRNVRTAVTVVVCNK